MAAAVLRTDTSVFDLSTKIKRAIQFATTRALSISLAAMIAVSLFIMMEWMVRIDEVTFTTPRDPVFTDFIAEDPEPIHKDISPLPVKPDILQPPPSLPIDGPIMDKTGLPTINIPEAPLPAQPEIIVSPTDVNVSRQPRAIRYPIAAYPKRAASAGLSGTCDVFFSLDHTGAPFNISATCSDPVFVTSAERAVRKARFAAATDANGRPIPAKNMVYPLEYRMAD